jgi:hypothetical protein
MSMTNCEAGSLVAERSSKAAAIDSTNITANTLQHDITGLKNL